MNLYQDLYDALERLAAPASTQLAWVTREKVSIDELALSYDNAAGAAWQLVDAGSLTPTQLSSIAALLDDIVALGRNDADWTPSALHASTKWASIRSKAKAILVQLDVPTSRTHG